MSASPSPQSNVSAPFSGPAEPAAPATTAPVICRPALRSLAAHARLWTVAVLGLALDLWSKDWAFRTLGQGGHRPLVPYLLEFHTTLNPGALFGFGAGHTEVFLIASLLALGLVLWMFSHSPAQSWLTHLALAALLAGALGNMYDRAFVSLVEVPVQTVTAVARRCYVLDVDPDTQRHVLREYPVRADRPSHVIPLAENQPLPRPRGYVRDFIKIPTTLPRWNWIAPKWRGRELWPWVFNVADMLLVGGVAVLSLQLLRQRERRPAKTAGVPASSPDITAGQG